MEPSLLINRRAILPINTWLHAEDHPTKGYKHRPGWHCLPKPYAPHLAMKDRQWFRVQIAKVHTEQRPENQGGTWFLAQKIRILKPENNDVS